MAASRDELARQDEEDLRSLGYAQQLFREMGGFSNFAISFSIISVLTGAILLFGHGLKFGGPLVNTVGWPIVSIFTLTVAASMAELASAYPTAGGLYFWAFRLGGKRWAWWTAWLNMIGQVTATAAINYAAATYTIGAVTRIFGLDEKAHIPIFGDITNWYFQVTVMAVLMIPQVLINCFGIRLVARLNDISVWWHIAGVAIIVMLLTFAGKHHNPASFLVQGGYVVSPMEASSAVIDGQSAPAIVIGEWKAPSPLMSLLPWLKGLYESGPLWLAFVLALLQAQWTYTGYDASAHVAEETIRARKNSAWGIFLSVAISAVVGWILILSLTWCVPRGDIAAVTGDTYPVLYIVYENLSSAMGNLVAVIIGGAMWLCGCSSISSMCRMWYAFARDDGMPGSNLMKQIHPKYRTPIPAILITSVLAVLICLYAAAFTVVTSISTIALYLAYAMPVWLNLRNKVRHSGEYTTRNSAPWNLGKSGPLLNAVSLIWVALISIIFVLPPNELVLWTMLGIVVILAVYWAGYARRNFHGPTRADEAALRADIRQDETPEPGTA
jgi:amino acid transporter